MADVDAHRRARRMRQALTPPEARLWSALRRQGLGVKFRRQHPVGPYILDFFCSSLRLAIEVDGASHGTDESALHDARRTRWRASQGIDVVRVAAIDVRRDIHGVLDALRAIVSERCAAPAVTTLARRATSPQAERRWLDNV